MRKRAERKKCTKKERGTMMTVGQDTPKSSQHTLKVPRTGVWWWGMHFIKMWWDKNWKLGPCWACFSRVPGLQFWQGLMDVDEKVAGHGVVFDKKNKNKEVRSVCQRDCIVAHMKKMFANISSLQKGQKSGMHLTWNIQWTCSLLHKVFSQFMSIMAHIFSSGSKLGP